MKNSFFLFFFLFLMGNGLNAQPKGLPTMTLSSNCGITFSYDDAGNRIRRSVCMSRIGLQFEEQLAEGAIQTLDLEGMIAESGYSQSLEDEINHLENLLSQASELDLKSIDRSKDQQLELTDQHFANLANMVVFPNPTMNSFSIQGDQLNPEATLSIVGMDGRILSQRPLGDGRDIDASFLPTGTYMLTLFDQENRRVSLLVKSGE